MMNAPERILKNFTAGKYKTGDKRTGLVGQACSPPSYYRLSH